VRSVRAELPDIAPSYEDDRGDELLLEAQQ
jgi:hypothetical protein